MTTKNPADDDDDFKELDAFGPSDDFGDVARTRVANMDNVSTKSAVTQDRERAKKLGISMAGTHIEPLPPGRVAFVEMPNGSPVILNKSVTVIGRSAGVADIVLDDTGVSRQHAAVLYAKGEFFLEDLGSSNGTVVNGERISIVQLPSGTEFSLGPHVCRFKVREK